MPLQDLHLPSNKLMRIWYATESAGLGWQCVLFTNELAFKVGECLAWQMCHRRKGQAYDANKIAVKVKGAALLHVWGAIAHGVKLPLIRFDLRPIRTIDGVCYTANKTNAKVHINQILQGPLQDYITVLQFT